jgi:uncharacterized LabA/DUF88 family protein
MVKIENSLIKSRVIFYIDGYNLYCGMVEYGWRKYLWLDIVGLCQSLLKPYQELVQVKYHTSLIKQPERRSRQDMFLLANKQNPKFKYFLGKFKPTEQDKYQEKKTDVNIAVNMIRDTIKRNCETICLITGDSDLVPAIQFLFELDPKIKMLTFFPPERYSSEINKNSTKAISLERYEESFKNNQFLDELRINDFQTLKRPEKWK